MQKLLLRNSAVYSIAAFTQKAMMFLLLPFYTQYLSPQEYGIISVVLASSFFWTVFFTLGLDSAIVRFYYNEKYRDDFGTFAGTLIISIFVFSILSYSLLISAGAGLIRLFYSDIPLYPLAYLGLLILIFQPVYNFTLSFLQAKNQALKYTILSFIYFLLNVALTVLLVVILEEGPVGYILSILLAYLVSCLLGLFILRKEFALTFRLAYLKDALFYSYPFIPHSFIAQASGDMDKFILNRFIQTSTVGIYQVAYSITYAVDILAHSAGRAFSPLFIQSLSTNTPEGRNEILKSTDIVIFLFLTFTLGCSFFIPDVILLLFDSEYHRAVDVVPVLAFGFLNSGLYYLFSNPLFFDTKLTRFIPVCTLLSGAVTIGLDFLLIPSFGMLGAATAVFMGRLALLIVASYFASRSSLISWPYRKTIYAYAAAIAFASLAWIGSDGKHSMGWIAIKLMAFVASLLTFSFIVWNRPFGFVDFVTGMFTKAQIKK